MELEAALLGALLQHLVEEHRSNSGGKRFLRRVQHGIERTEWKSGSLCLHVWIWA